VCQLHSLQGISTRAKYVEVTEALGNCYSNYHLKAAFHSKVTQSVRESLQEFATAIDHLAHSTHAELPEHLISKEVNRLRKRNIGQMLVLWGKKTFSKALNQGLELQAAETPSRVPQTTAIIFWRS
jgi:FKBP-type peptidyl-prolyl cis-trans isomerase (trigger factor)